MSDEILSRISALEAQVAELMPAMERRPFRHYPAGWIRERIDNRAAERRGGRVEHFDLRIEGDIDHAMAHRVADEMSDHALATSVNVFVDSEGGDYHAAVRIFRTVLWHAAASKTAVLGKSCMSAGVIVALAADRRIASPATQLLFHGVSNVPDHRERWCVHRHLQALRELRELDIELVNIAVDRTGADLATIAAEAATEDYMPLDQARHLGFVHEVTP